MRSAILEALPAAVLVASEGFAVAAVVSWLVIAPLWNAAVAWASAPVVAGVAAVFAGCLVLRHALRVATESEVQRP